jgi:hypothetical protein
VEEGGEGFLMLRRLIFFCFFFYFFHFAKPWLQALTMTLSSVRAVLEDGVDAFLVLGYPGSR